MSIELITPDWPAPKNVHASSTTRIGGVSAAPFAGFNLGARAGDDIESVSRNRALLREQLQLPTEPAWLWQTHSTTVVDAATAQTNHEADAAWTATAEVVCTVMTADCLPVLFADKNGRCVGAAHAGWRGLLNGVLEATIDAMPAPAGQIMAWLGPCIGAQNFIVGADVFDAFCADNDKNSQCFQSAREPKKWLADLHALAGLRLLKAGIKSISAAPRCTVNEPDVFFSYRREGMQSGRMATLIWLQG